MSVRKAKKKKRRRKRRQKRRKRRKGREKHRLRHPDSSSPDDSSSETSTSTSDSTDSSTETLDSTSESGSDDAGYTEDESSEEEETYRVPRRRAPVNKQVTVVYGGTLEKDPRSPWLKNGDEASRTALFRLAYLKYIKKPRSWATHSASRVQNFPKGSSRMYRPRSTMVVHLQT